MGGGKRRGTLRSEHTQHGMNLSDSPPKSEQPQTTYFSHAVPSTKPTGPTQPSPALSHLQAPSAEAGLRLRVFLSLWFGVRRKLMNTKGQKSDYQVSQERKGLFLKRRMSGGVATSDSLQMRPAACQCWHCKAWGVGTCQGATGHPS